MIPCRNPHGRGLMASREDKGPGDLLRWIGERAQGIGWGTPFIGPPVEIGKSLFKGMTSSPGELFRNIAQGADPAFGFGAAGLYGRPEDENLPIQFLVGALTPGFGEFKALGKPLKALISHFREFPEGSLAVLKNQMGDIPEVLRKASRKELSEFLDILDTRRIDRAVEKGVKEAKDPVEDQLWEMVRNERVGRAAHTFRSQLKEGTGFGKTTYEEFDKLSENELIRLADWMEMRRTNPNLRLEDIPLAPEGSPQTYKMDFGSGDTPKEGDLLSRIGELSEGLDKYGKTWKGMLNRSRRTPIGERDVLDKLADDMIEYSRNMMIDDHQTIRYVLGDHSLASRIDDFVHPEEVAFGAEAHLINELKIISEIEKGNPNAAKWYLDALKKSAPDLYEGIETVDDLVRSERILMNKNKAEYILSRYYNAPISEIREALNTHTVDTLAEFSNRIRGLMDNGTLFDIVGEMRASRLKIGGWKEADDIFKAMSLEPDMTDQILTEASVQDLHDILSETFEHTSHGIEEGRITSGLDWDPRGLQKHLEEAFPPEQIPHLGSVGPIRPLHLSYVTTAIKQALINRAARGSDDALQAFQMLRSFYPDLTDKQIWANLVQISEKNIHYKEALKVLIETGGLS